MNMKIDTVYFSIFLENILKLCWFAMYSLINSKFSDTDKVVKYAWFCDPEICVTQDHKTFVSSFHWNDIYGYLAYTLVLSL